MICIVTEYVVIISLCLAWTCISEVGELCSRIFVRRGKLYMGLFLAKTSGSTVAFLKTDLIAATLKDCGRWHVNRGRLIY